ncbi:MAG: thiamine-binding protein [Acidimicrobiales bacterium]
MDVTAEFTIEPFVEGTPGSHVRAALDAVRAAGLEPVIGPFGSSVTGELGAVSAALAQMVEAATAAGATTVSVQVTLAGPP